MDDRGWHLGFSREGKKRVFQPRGRRDCFGELVQIDASHHWWFENRGPKCALLVYIDDATGRLLHLRFAGSENTFDYLHATKAYLQQWGKPLSFYSDKHGVFRSTHASEKDRTNGLTQFGGSFMNSTSTSSGPTLPRPRVVWNAPTRRCRIAR